ncbi:MAG: YfhO family protein [Bacilli bacterium]|nr:YfhO family protein [Bacilli bacterium]
MVGAAKEKRQGRVAAFFHLHFPGLFHIGSTFYFALFVIFLSMAWMGYALITNEFTQMLNWDYTWQFLPFAYDYHDAWRTFFATGHFPLYDGNVFLGTDNIGSGSYYGLFDPFVVALILFPRAALPQAYAILTFLRFAVSALLMRSYLKYLGTSEWVARIGAIAYAFSGFATFMSGFPNVLTATVYIPMILWGIERVIKEQKPGVLIWGIFLEGITSFFYLVVVCIWGVFYALWRYFWTIKSRDRRANVCTIVLGVCSFAAGLMLCAFTWIPSVRESALSGRASSIGSAYLHAVLNSLKSHDFASFFGFIFEEVGDHPGRELMGLISFFFPTGGFTRLPLANSGYDAWTAALFCYTPLLIAFTMALLHSLRLRKWNHIIAVLLCAYLCFTNMAYFMFYAFSGNGYGRWYIVLVPVIIAYACWGLEQRGESSRAIPILASLLTLAGTIIVYYVADAVLKGVKFEASIYNVHGTTYWQSEYHTASEIYDGVYAAWFFYYQLALIFIETVVLLVGYRKQWLPKALFGCLTVEIVLMGNITYAYNGLWSLSRSFGGGTENVQASLKMTEAIKAQDNSFFRAHNDLDQGTSYLSSVAGYKTAIAFHSLMNFEVDDFAFNNQLKNAGSTSTTYGDTKIYNPNWSGSYLHKRFGADTTMGYRYYMIKNNYSGYRSPEGESYFFTPNVPFFAQEIPTSLNRDRYRVYGVPQDKLPNLGYAVSDDELYYLGHDETRPVYETSFYHDNYGTAAFREMQRAQEVQLWGAMIEDNVVLPGFEIKKTVPSVLSDQDMLVNYGLRRYAVGNGVKVRYYETGLSQEDKLLPDGKADYAGEGLAYFLNHNLKFNDLSASASQTVKRDYGKVVLHQNGEYLNDDPRGAYFEFHYYNSSKDEGPRVYAIGDRFDETGKLVEENAVLSFDHALVSNAVRSSYWQNKMATFGLYARGRVKYLCFCYGGSGEISVNMSDVYYIKKEFAEIATVYDTLQENRLQDVQTDVNTFSFSTNYEKDRVVVTTLGFDKGWGGTVTLPGGKTEPLTMLKLDGGLVGFVARGSVGETGPQTYRYLLRYETPYSKLSAFLWCCGVIGYFGFLGGSFFLAVHKKKRPRA